MRRIVLLFTALILLGLYLVIMDPYSESFINDLPYGIAVLFAVKTFLLVITFILLLNVIVDIELDHYYGVDEKEVINIAVLSSKGAGLVLISRALRFVAASIVTLGVLIYTSG